MPSVERQWSGKTQGGRFGQRFLVGLFRRVRVTVVYSVLPVIIPFYLLFGRKGYHAIYGYFHHIWGYGAWRSFWLTVKNHIVFGKVVLDRFAVLAGKADQFHFDVDGRECFEQYLDTDKPCIIVGGHIGNLELAGHCMRQDKKQVNGVVFAGESANLQDQRQESLEQSSVHMIPIKDDMSHIFAIKEAIDRGEFVIVACDRTMGNTQMESLNLLGHPAHFPIAMFKMAVRSAVDMLAFFVVKGKGTRYKVYVRPLKMDTGAITLQDKIRSLMEQYVGVMESVLRIHPEQWFNYYDFWGLDTHAIPTR